MSVASLPAYLNKHPKPVIQTSKTKPPDVHLNNTNQPKSNKSSCFLTFYTIHLVSVNKLTNQHNWKASTLIADHLPSTNSLSCDMQTLCKSGWLLYNFCITSPYKLKTFVPNKWERMALIYSSNRCGMNRYQNGEERGWFLM